MFYWSPFFLFWLWTIFLHFLASVLFLAVQNYRGSLGFCFLIFAQLFALHWIIDAQCFSFYLSVFPVWSNYSLNPEAQCMHAYSSSIYRISLVFHLKNCTFLIYSCNKYLLLLNLSSSLLVIWTFGPSFQKPKCWLEVSSDNSFCSLRIMGALRYNILFKTRIYVECFFNMTFGSLLMNRLVFGRGICDYPTEYWDTHQLNWSSQVVEEEKSMGPTLGVLTHPNLVAVSLGWMMSWNWTRELFV